MGRISLRLGAVAESATLAVDAKAKALAAAGERVVSFGAGEPDFPTPPHIVEAAVAACRDPKSHKYSPTPGLPELRAAIAERLTVDTDYAVEPAQVLVTNGAKQAVYNTFGAICDPGDEILVPAPFWTTYPECIALGGGVPVAVATSEANGFKVTVDDLEAARTPKTKGFLFVSPSNPTGSVHTREEVEAIGRWAAENGIWAVTDEIYQHLVYGDAEHHSLPAVVPEAADHTIVLGGVSKSYAMTGWRVGWLVGPKDLVTTVANYQSHTTSNVSNISQRAAVAALTWDQSCVGEMRQAFERRRKRAVDMLTAIPGVSCNTPGGAFYAYPNLTAHVGRAIRGRTPANTLELADLILDEARVAIVPGEAFGTPGYARISYAVGDDDLGEGLTRLGDLLSEGM
jgi:aspartate aminotransferase